MHTEVEVRLSNRKAVGSGYDGFEGKEGPGNFFWISGCLGGRRICACCFPLSLSPSNYSVLRANLSTCLSLFTLVPSSPPPPAQKQSHRSNYIATAHCLTTCYLHFSTADSLASPSASISYFLPHRNKILSHF